MSGLPRTAACDPPPRLGHSHRAQSRLAIAARPNPCFTLVRNAQHINLHTLPLYPRCCRLSRRVHKRLLSAQNAWNASPATPKRAQPHQRSSPTSSAP
ncbi:hypothetical protein J1614_008525 [Plenodomus biglobosus]|nr:hypothetical protein J1614_008525 [Plenodomus biglobosus]